MKNQHVCPNPTCGFGVSLRFIESYAGCKVQCRNCQHWFVIPWDWYYQITEGKKRKGAEGIKSARISECGQYRYELRRTWNAELPLVNFIGLNPSTADDKRDDPTMRRCIQFARDWGYGGLIMSNALALRATKPAELLKHADPKGPENDAAIVAASAESSRIVCAWGSHRIMVERGPQVIRLLKGYDLFCLKLTDAGAPWHPLYLPKSTVPIPYKPIREVEA